MKYKGRLVIGVVIFVLMSVDWAFLHFSDERRPGSYDGWTANRTPNSGAVVTNVDPNGPATALQVGDELLRINGVPINDGNPNILNFNRTVPPGTRYPVQLRRNQQLLELTLQTVPYADRAWTFNRAWMAFVYLLFLLTGGFIFLLRRDDRQAWLLTLMLWTMSGLTGNNPSGNLPNWFFFMILAARTLALGFMPLMLHFFLIFPEPAPWLRRFPQLERWLYVPFFLLLLPSLGLAQLPPRWLGSTLSSLLRHPQFLVAGKTFVVLYLVGGLLALVINYRAADAMARRRLRVILIGSGLGILNLLLMPLGEWLGWQPRLPQLWAVLNFTLMFTLPMVPLSFAYAIIRHKVIPVSLMIRRGVRYLLVSRGAVILEFVTVVAVLTVVLRTIMIYFQASHLVVGLVSGVVSVVVWQVTRTIHNRYFAPLIDRKFFRQSYDAQQIMAELSEELRSTTNRAQLPALVASKIQAALQTERVTILLKDEATNAYQCAYSCDYDPRSSHSTARVNGHQFTAQTELTNRLLASADPLEVDWEGETARVENVETLLAAETTTLRALNSALLLPLKGKDEMSGIISLGARLGDLPFSNEDKRMLLSVSAPMSFALENTRLIERMIEDARRREELEAENEQRAKELEEARQLQLSMLPKKVPDLPHVEIAAYMKTATEVGGDYYDFHVSSDGTLTIAVGDATGHGLKAGTVVTAMKGLFHTHAHNDELLSVLTQSSHALKAMNLRSLFMALTLVKLHSNELQIASAGMPPTLIYHAHTNSVEEVLMRTMPLGSLRNYPYRDEQFHLQVGDVVVLLSDGFPERFNAEGEMLGFDKAQEVLQATAQLSAQQIIERFIHIEEQWAQGFAPNDDITFVVLKVKS